MNAEGLPEKWRRRFLKDGNHWEIWDLRSLTPVEGAMMPTGCDDLLNLGYLKKNGFYTVKSPTNSKLLTVYFDFNKKTNMKGY